MGLAACSPLKEGAWSPDGSPRADAPALMDVACPRESTRCGDRCVDLRNDPLHCGRCGEACDGGACAGGRCR